MGTPAPGLTPRRALCLDWAMAPGEAVEILNGRWKGLRGAVVSAAEGLAQVEVEVFGRKTVVEVGADELRTVLDAEALLAQLCGPDPEVRPSAAAALRSCEAEVAPALMYALGHAAAEVRGLACWALEAQGPGSVGALLGALDDPEESVRMMAAGALGTFGEQARSALPALERALLDWSGGGVQAYPTAQAEALAAVGGVEALPALIQALGSPRSRLRMAALRGLMSLRQERPDWGPEPALNATLQALLEDEVPEVRTIASELASTLAR